MYIVHYTVNLRKQRKSNPGKNARGQNTKEQNVRKWKTAQNA